MTCSSRMHEENVLLTLFPGRPGSLLFVSSSCVEWIPPGAILCTPLTVLYRDLLYSLSVVLKLEVECLPTFLNSLK